MKTDETSPQDWYFLAEDRLRTADAAVNSIGVTYSAIELLQEAAERYIKGFLISKGWQLIRTHNLRELVKQAQGYDPAFGRFTDLANALTLQFFLLHYPGEDLTGIGEDYAELRKQLGELIALIAPHSSGSDETSQPPPSPQS